MRICGFCGSELPDQVGFCRICGQTISGSAPYLEGSVAPSIPGPSQAPPGVGIPGGMLPILPPLILPAPPSPLPPSYLPPSPPAPGSRLTVRPHYPPTPGYLTWLIVVILPLIILAGIFSGSLIVFTPTLSLSGGTNVVAGGSLHVHGNNFLPGNAVTLTLDNTLPLYFTHNTAPSQAAQYGQHMTSMWAQADRMTQLPNATVPVEGDGTFNVNITVGQDWSVGPHTIKAEEAFTLRSATLPFIVSWPGQTPTPLPPISLPTQTATASATSLSIVNPSTVTLGPVSQGYDQAISTQVTLNTTGTDLLTWTATWDQNQAPWLQLDRSSGQIQAPNMQTITVSALATNLKAGSYSATITFNSVQSNQSVGLNVSLTVQAGCISVTPRALTFTGVAGSSDPPAQTIALNNCGVTGTWSASMLKDGSGNWISVNPTSLLRTIAIVSEAEAGGNNRVGSKLAATS